MVGRGGVWDLHASCEKRLSDVIQSHNTLSSVQASTDRGYDVLCEPVRPFTSRHIYSLPLLPIVPFCLSFLLLSSLVVPEDLTEGKAARAFELYAVLQMRRKGGAPF